MIINVFTQVIIVMTITIENSNANGKYDLYVRIHQNLEV